MELKLGIPCWIFTIVSLLIVPYGIETCAAGARGHRKAAFNRTLWN